jgi:vancomycin resistance protein YoaR
VAKAKNVLLVFVFLFGFFLVYNILYIGKVFPNIFVSEVNIGNLKPDEAAFILSGKITPPQTIKLVGSQGSFDVDTKDINLSYDFSRSAQRAYELPRTGNIFLDFWQRTALIWEKKEIGLTTKVDESKLNKVISMVDGQISQDPVYPSAKITGGSVTINKGQKGTSLNSDLLRAVIGKNLSLAKSDDIEIPVTEVDPTLNDDQVRSFEERANKYLGKTINLKFEFDTYSFASSKILPLLDPKGKFNDKELNKVIFDLAQKVNRDPQEPKLSFEGGKVTQFQPAKDGVEVNSTETKQVMTDLLTKLETSEEKVLTGDIKVKTTPPKTTTGEVNNLGIKELIGRGTSTFYHSIPGRVHNVVLAASRINGILVKPGDTFSFNENLGDVSAFTGYAQAYIISGGKTVLGDGGGVCQVSTTLFRALLNAGLPITERQAHAYRVGYYEQDSPPGIDATVYSPSPDLKFKNDTGNSILITAKANPKNYSLIFELYGTSDGRTSIISKPIVTNVVPAPPDLYQDDPTLPAGTVKQVDFRAAGAKVTFNYAVTKAGETIYKKTFISNYRPWQAIYLRGTAPVQ